MKKYVRDAVNELKKSDKLKSTILLKNKDDYKKNPFRIAYNRVIFKIQRKITPSHLKNWLLRTTGLNVGHDACLPHDIGFDPFFPDLIYLEAGCIFGAKTVCTHTLENNKLTLGKVIVKPRALVSGRSTLLPGAVVNKNCILNYLSELNREMPEGELWGGKPAKFIMKFSKEELDKYFRPSNGKSKEYYKEFHKRVKAFVKDPNQNYFKMHYDGNRLNAGNDWWRVRNIFKIYYNGILTELARISPTSFLRKLLYRMMGVKLGKNVYLGKGVTFDHLCGDLNEVGDNTRIDDYCYIGTHEYTITQSVLGKCRIGNNVHIKHDCFIRGATIIGDNTTIEPNSILQREIPSDVVWGGFPVAKLIKEKRK